MNNLYYIILSVLCFGFFNNIVPQESESSSFQNFRNKLREAGVDISAVYTGEYFHTISGGIKSGGVYLDNFDFEIEADLEKLISWNGAKIHSHFLGNNGGIPSEYTGAVQGISNIAAEETWKLYELFLSQELFNNFFFLRAGLIDLNMDFDERETSALFINPAHGIGTEFALSSENGPAIFPTTSLAVLLYFNFSDAVNLAVGAYDGVPGDPDDPFGTQIVFGHNDGVLFANELTITLWDFELQNDFLRFVLGNWYYTRTFDDISETIMLEDGSEGAAIQREGNLGYYFSVEGSLLREKRNSPQGINAFLRVGWADKDINRIDQYIGGGLVYRGLFEGRENDTFGFAFAAAHNNERFIEKQLVNNLSYEEWEINFELTYALEIVPWFVIQPNLQYILNPGEAPGIDDAFIGGARFAVSF